MKHVGYMKETLFNILVQKMFICLKAIYFQSIVDINLKVLEVGDEVCYVFGTGLDKGVIESITPFEFGTSGPRIKIKGKKLINAFNIMKI
jgi:hypothetical protein